MLRIVNEPTAAALAHGLDKKKNETIASDFGGGIVRHLDSRGGEGVVEVKATNGDTPGRRQPDQRVMDWIVTEFRKQEGIDLSKTGWRCSASRKRRRRPRWSSPP